MSRASGRRGLLLSAVLLLVLVILLDLLRADSVLLRAVDSLAGGSQTPAEQLIDDFRRTRGGSIRP